MDLSRPEGYSAYGNISHFTFTILIDQNTAGGIGLEEAELAHLNILVSRQNPIHVPKRI